MLATYSGVLTESPDFSKFASKEYPAHKKGIFSLDWNSSGTLLASASEDTTIKVWNLDTASLDKAHDLKDHTAIVEQLSWQPENADILASVSSDRTLRIWDMRMAKKNMKTVQSKGSNLNVAWSPDGKIIAVANNEDYITFYDFSNLSVIKQIKFDKEVNELSWDLTGQILLITTSNENGLTGPITVLDGKTFSYPDPLQVLDFHRGRCYCISVSRDGKYFATGAADALIALWDVEELVSVKTFSKTDCQIRQLSFSHDSLCIAAAAEDFSLDIYNIESGESIKKIDCNSPQHAVAWHPKRYILAYTLEEKEKGEDSCPIHLFGQF